MQRRRFLSAATSLVAVACSAHEAQDGQGGPGLFPSKVATGVSLFPQSVASGDPKPTSVILWTRCPEHSTVYLQLSRDRDFEQVLDLSGGDDAKSGDPGTLELKSKGSQDHCVKVKVGDLSPNTVYYYRFIVDTDDGPKSSRVGRTKTAPGEDEDVAVRFAVMSCQDYQGRYYHSLRQAAELEPDFVVHLGDYIYETADDPRFQSDSAERSIAFRDVEGAEVNTFTLEDGTEQTSLAAKSLDNYRQLYQTYRGDALLQRLHETAPFIAVWDDHEFANDATRNQSPTASEAEPIRRGNADQAWFEYMPVDFAVEPTLGDGEFPGNLIIYRDFRFGKHLHLVMTDLRRFRPPPLIAEDAFPGKVLLTEAELRDLHEELPDFAAPYVQLDEAMNDATRFALQAAAPGWNIEPEAFTGYQDIATLNTWIERYNTEFDDEISTFAETDAIGRGVAAVHLGKSELRSSIGSRYFVVKEAYETLSLAAYTASNGESENILGTEQRQWFLDTLKQSNATWKVWGNEYTFLSKAANLAGLPLGDPSLARNFLVSVDDWDGVPHERAALLRELSEVERLVVVTGDIHSFFVGTTGLPDSVLEEAVRQPLEFVCGAVSSATYDTLIGAGIALPGITDVGPLASAVLSASNPHVSYQSLDSNGFALVTADKRRLDVAFYQLASSKVQSSTLDGDIEGHFEINMHTVDLEGRLS